MTDKEKQYLIDGLLEYMDDYRYQIDAKEKAYALADKRLVLLKAANKDRVQQGSRCSHCKKLPKVISIWHGDYKFKDVHTDDCELAEAIAEE